MDSCSYALCGLGCAQEDGGGRGERASVGWRLAQETRTFGTMTADLLALSDWLTSYGVTHVAHGEHRRVLEAGLQHLGEQL